MVVLVENAARLSIPFLVKEGIDTGIPPIQAGRRPRAAAASIVGAACSPRRSIQAVARQLFLVRSGRIGQDILLELRRRVFRHFQRLSPAFHDATPPGRVISRQTSDIDAIYELLETGFDGLVTAALTLVGIGGAAARLDLQLGLVALLCVPVPAAWLTNWFRKESAKTYRRHPRDGRAGDRALRRVAGRHPRGAGVPPRAAQPGDLRRRQRPVPRAPTCVAFRLVALVHAGHQADRQRHDRASCCSTAATAPIDGEVTVGVLAAFLLYLRQFFEPMQEISQFYNTFQSASRRAGEAVRRARGGARRARAGRPGAARPTPRGERALRRTSGSPTSRARRCCPTST